MGKRVLGRRRVGAQCVATFLSGAAVFFAAPAGAQTDEAAAAEVLFNEARSLFDGGKIADACEKFAESQRLDPSAGTLLNLARCREAEGKFASAWSAYLAARRTAKTDGREALAEEAERKAQELEARLSYLTVKVGTEVEGLVITRGDEEVTEATYGTKLPVDPDTYTIKAVAPGYTEWTSEVTVGAGSSEEVLVPALSPVKAVPEITTQESKPEQAEQAPPPAAASEGSHDSSSPALAYAIGGAGVAVTVGGLVFGGLAASKYSKAEKECPDRVGCESGTVNSVNTAETFALVSTIGVAVGLAGVATGVVLLILHDPNEEAEAKTTTDFRADVGWVPGGGFAQLTGSF